MLWILKEPSQWNGSFEHPDHMLKLMSKKILTFLRSKNLFYLNLFYHYIMDLPKPLEAPFPVK